MNLNEKLLELRKDLDYFQKSAQGYNYKYVAGVDILVKIRPKMDELGLLLVPSVEGFTTNLDQPKKQTVEMEMNMTWINVEDGEKLRVSFAAFGQQDDLSKAFGSALTYAERYFLMKFFQIPTDDDDPDKFKKKNTPKNKDKSSSNPGKIIASKEETDALKEAAKNSGWPDKAVFPYIQYVTGIKTKGDVVKELTTGECERITDHFLNNQPPGEPEPMCTEPQKKLIYAAQRNNHIPEEEGRRTIMSRYKKEHIRSDEEPEKSLTESEASNYIDWIERPPNGD